ncbi:ATP-binding protein [Desulfobacterales bacterium HSG16]|nr:ATP-binding protein [Desulfobacterales bacterium HSG16]
MKDSNNNLLYDQDDELFFAEETPVKSPGESIETSAETWKIMIVDDEKDLHKITQMILDEIIFDGRKLSCLSAYSGKQACEMIRDNPDTALILLDVVMETISAGLDVTEYIRSELQNNIVRIVLRTGQPGHAPERDVITRYDINDYKLKTVLTDHTLFTTVISALRSYRDLRFIEQSRKEIEDALEQARAAEKARTQFLANMQHELMTPLNGILGGAEILLNTSMTKKQKNFTEIIRTSGQGLFEIISNVLDLTNIEEGQLVLKETTFGLRELVARIISVLKIQAEWKQLSVFHFIDDEVPDILTGDPDRLKQVLMNLTVNAIKYTEAGCIALDVSIFRESGLSRDNISGDKPGNYIDILFEVNDTGIGIPSDKQDDIFEPFTLCEEVRTKRLDGAGLGLAISREIIEKMGGKIWMSSKPDKGSSFYFTARFKKQGNEA